MDWLEDYDFILGTYESYVIGYKFDSARKEFVLSFTDEAHNGSVRALASGGKYLLSSGSDENIKIYNLRNKKEFGSLHHAEGLVRSMVFFKSRYLFTASDDHRLHVLKTGTWKVEKTLFKHQGPVLDISIHPSGKLALSIGEDFKLVTWNLIKGRSAYITNLRERPDLVTWCPKGEHYLVGFRNRVDVYEVESAEVIHSIKISGRTNSIAFLDDESFVLATESPRIEVHSLSSKEKLFDFEAHEKRVRCVEVIQKGCSPKVLVSVSNDGWLKLWELSEDRQEFNLLGQVNSRCRITCLQAHRVPPVTEGLKEKGENKESVEKTSLLSKDLLQKVKERCLTIDEEVKAVKEKRSQLTETKEGEPPKKKKRKKNNKKVVPME
uniref:p21-activated protein kinase-interacting protein 1-like n=1 Tax=Caligus rogercresseyi TaxID=217165 RepID=C1BRN5_CALRO|nr:p21-activated protein kinase-interacting protein 1-like [Caligus rogercresseyi]